ncbi:MAG TPA: class I SAM-dependent methyltransferase [Patescibacteria group bacterium]|nr:class I SAM-dependent methyltransferase [Patescibacteria group bacterium]
MNFSPQDRKRIGDYYRQRLDRYGVDSAEALSWSSQQAQQIRFQVLTQVGDLRGKSILDVGSGLGDLYALLQKTVGEFDYLGVDLVPDLVTVARAKYPQAQFENRDILDFNDRKFDYVLSSGAMSFKVPQHFDKYFAMIRKMFSLARLGLAFNMLDQRGHIDNELYAAYNPSEIEAFCRTLTPKVKLITHYSPQDFTLLLHP